MPLDVKHYGSVTVIGISRIFKIRLKAASAVFFIDFALLIPNYQRYAVCRDTLKPSCKT